MTDMTAEQALEELLDAATSIVMTADFDEADKWAAIIRQALNAPRVPEGWEIERIDSHALRVYRPDRTNCYAEYTSGDACESMLFEVCSAMLAASPAPVAPQPEGQIANHGAVHSQAEAWKVVVATLDALQPGWILQVGKTAAESAVVLIRHWFADASQYHVVMAEGLTTAQPPAEPAQDEKVHAVSLASEVPGHEKRGVIGHYKIHHKERDYDSRGCVAWQDVVDALNAPRVPGAIDADKLHAEKEALDPQAKTPYMHTLRWAQGWNACREAMLAGVPVLTHVTLTNEGDIGQVSDSDELAEPAHNSYDKVIADQDAEIAKLRGQEQSARLIIESMENDAEIADAELTKLRGRVKVLEELLEPDMFWWADDPEHPAAYDLDGLCDQIFDNNLKPSDGIQLANVRLAVSLPDAVLEAKVVERDGDFYWEARLRGGGA